MYNVSEEPETYKEIINITVLSGVFVDEVKASNVRASGNDSADSVTLYIPLNINAVDGVTGQKKRYAGANTYNKMQNKSGAWTMDTDGNTFFVKGRAIEPEKDFQYINANYNSVYKVTKVDLKDFGTADMQHWEVGGA